jgi:thiamine pyrophosphokinase
VAARAIVVVAGGGPPSPNVVDDLPRAALVVAADSGVDSALALGLHIDVVVGDLDSVTPEGLSAAEAGGARIVRHPAAKEATDLTLALGEAATLLEGAGEVFVIGGDGGRLDHLLAGVLALTDDAWAGLTLRAHLGRATVHVLHGPGKRELGGSVGDLVTLIPVGGLAEGVRTSGLRYPLDAEPLRPATTRGVSNLIESLPATVALEAGVLLAVLPGDEVADEQGRDR